MKVLFIPFAPSLAHLTRCLSVAESMKVNNHEILFAVGAEGRNLIEGAGFNLVIVPEIDSDTFKNSKGWSWFTKAYVIENLNAELNIIDDFNPDIIIYDFRFTTKLAARIKSIKSFSIMHASALSLTTNTKKTAIKIITNDNLSGKKTLKDHIFEYIFPLVFTTFLSKPLKNIRPLLKQYNCQGIKTVFDLLPGDFNLIADPLELIPKELSIPENCIIAGPLTWSGWNMDSNFSLDNFDSNPLLYITMGSTVEAKPILVKLIESLKELPFNIIISKGQTDLRQEEFPSNVFLYSYVPGNYVASKSSLVIYHGGHETLMQVLSNGVPSLVIPINPDQILVAKQIKDFGLGNFLKHPNSFPMEKQPLKHFSAIEISDEVMRIINDIQCKRRCEDMRNSFRKMIEAKAYLKAMDNCLNL